MSMTAFDIALDAYLQEHGEIDGATYESLRELYATEMGLGQKVADAKAHLKIAVSKKQTEKMRNGLVGMGEDALSSEEIDALIEKVKELYDTKKAIVAKKAARNDITDESDIVEKYSDEMDKACKNVVSAITSIRNNISSLNSRDLAVFSQILRKTAITDKDIDHIGQIACAKKYIDAAKTTVDNALTLADNAISASVELAKKTGKKVADVSKQAYAATKSAIGKGVNTSRNAIGSAIENLAFKLSDGADKIKTHKESVYDELVEAYIEENGSIDVEAMELLREYCELD